MMATYLTQRDVQDYGADLIDFSQRAAVQALEPTLQNIQQQNAALQARLAQEAKHRLDHALDVAVPDWKTINSDPLWHRWLLQPDQFSGIVRQRMLDDATRQGDASRIISFFAKFLQENRHAESASSSSGSSRASSRGASTSALGQRTYTRDDIKQLYEAHRQGAYKGREAEWAKQEVDVFRALREGRIADHPFLTK